MKQMDRRIKKGVLFVPIFIGGLFLFTLFVMLLWNAVLPAVIPAIKVISYWQAMGILVLSKMLFGFGGGWGGKRRMWRERMDEKWQTMTPEEKEKFKAEWKNRCAGRWGRFDRTEDATTLAAE